MSRQQKLKLEEALTNRETYISQMCEWNDSKLEKHLDLFRQQLEMAYKQKDEDAIRLLTEYENQVIMARFENC
jgi:hypothetical protein